MLTFGTFTSRSGPSMLPSMSGLFRFGRFGILNLGISNIPLDEPMLRSTLGALGALAFISTSLFFGNVPNNFNLGFLTLPEGALTFAEGIFISISVLTFSLGRLTLGNSLSGTSTFEPDNPKLGIFKFGILKFPEGVSISILGCLS